MRRSEAALPIGERLDAIGARIKARRRSNLSPPRRRDNKQALAAQSACRLERLKSEYSAWRDAVEVFHGNVRSISKHMGYDAKTARRALWDLGLWPAVVQARARAAGDGVMMGA